MRANQVPSPCGFFLGAVMALLLVSAPLSAQNRASWLKEAKWGVMSHYMAEWIAPEAHESVEAWNRMVDGFDVKGLAEQLESVGAGYYLITIGQNSGYYIAPNATYDKLVGNGPSKNSRRDLVADLYDELHPRGIQLMVYLPSGAPNSDKKAVAALEWQNGPYRNREFQLKWEQVIREWGERWGEKVAGWWFDGCYWPNTMYRTKDAPNFESFAAAARAGNPNRAVSFNPGTIYRTISITPHEDFIAAEHDDPARTDVNRVTGGNVDGAQLHVLSYMGRRWGRTPPRFTTEQVITFTQNIIQQGGAFTWDVPAQPDGLIPESFMEQLQALHQALSN